jgi:hypothetical protein
MFGKIQWDHGITFGTQVYRSEVAFVQDVEQRFNGDLMGFYGIL